MMLAEIAWRARHLWRPDVGLFWFVGDPDRSRCSNSAPSSATRFPMFEPYCRACDQGASPATI